MYTKRAPTQQLVEISCDESGFSGTNLVGTNTDGVFAHASVNMDVEAATSCVREVRERVGSPTRELKSGRLLRAKDRSVLRWFLGTSGPLYGNAHVHLTDKKFFVLGRVIDLLVGEFTDDHAIGPYDCPGQPDQRVEAMAATLYRAGRSRLGTERWVALLESFNDLLRGKDRHSARTAVESFFHMVDIRFLTGVRGEVDEILELLWQARPPANSLRASILDDPTMVAALDPFFPALVQAVVHWGAGDKSVSIIHDEQSALTPRLVAQLKELFLRPHSAPQGRVTGLRRVDSRTDPRVQVADFVAGVARRIATDELGGRGDAELTALLRPYVDPWSIWGDDRSWASLRPPGD